MTEWDALWTYWFTFLIFAGLGFPFSRRLFYRFPDQGWAFSRAFGLLLVGWMAWLPSSLDWVAFSRTSIFICMGILALLGWVGLRKLDPISHRSDFKLIRWVLWEEFAFLGVMVFWFYMRGYVPDIIGLEKYMDYGFLVSCMKTQYFPPLDPWFARESINYYYFGHYLAAVANLVSNLQPSFTYHLQMNYLAGQATIGAFALGSGLLALAWKGKPKPSSLVWAGVWSALLINFFGNAHALVYLFFGKEPYWYPNATRFVANTIHEFPLYSYIVNDLHGHVSNIPHAMMSLGLIGILWFELKELAAPKDWRSWFPRSVVKLILGIALMAGTSYATSAWDYAIYLLIFGFVVWISVARVWGSPGKTKLQRFFDWPVLSVTGVFSLIAVVVSVVPFLPFWKNLVPVAKGIGIVPWGEGSPWWQLLVLWGTHLFPVLFFIFALIKDAGWLAGGFSQRILRAQAALLDVEVQIKENAPQIRGANTLPIDGSYYLLLFVLGVAYIVLVEWVYVKDIYPTHYRANTMFKFYFQIWSFMGILAGTSMALLWPKMKSIGVGRFLFALSVFSGALYSVKAMDQGLNLSQGKRSSIFGLEYLRRKSPSQDYAAIEWINQSLDGQPTILEGVGESYTEYGRISVHTGLPTVMGWPVHEWLWRGSWDQPAVPESLVEQKTGATDSVVKRVDEIKLIYEGDDFERKRVLLTKYGVRYIIVGDLERKKYPKLREDHLQALSVDRPYDQLGLKIYRLF